MAEIVDAIEQHTAKGLDPLGEPRDFAATRSGEQKVAQTIYVTSNMEVPGIGTAAAYASGDAFGGKGSFAVPVRGLIRSLTFVDIDNEKLPKDLVLFAQDFTATADNSVFAPTASELRFYPHVISILSGDFIGFSTNSIATVTAIDLAYEAPLERLWFQWVTRGADNIAAGSIPSFWLEIQVGG